MSRSHTRKRTRKTKLGSVGDLLTGRTVWTFYSPLPPRAWKREAEIHRAQREAARTAKEMRNAD